MHFTRKTISESSGLIIKEQWQIRKERLLASPALIIGFTGSVAKCIIGRCDFACGSFDSTF